MIIPRVISPEGTKEGWRGIEKKRDEEKREREGGKKKVKERGTHEKG